MLALSAGSKTTPVKILFVVTTHSSRRLSALTFAGPDISPTLLRLLLQQLGLEAGQSDLWRGETLELGLLQDRKGLQIGTGIVTTED